MILTEYLNLKKWTLWIIEM